MSRKKTNYKMKTFEKLKMLGIENDKDILNIIELRNSIRTKGLVGYLLDIQKE